MGSHPEEKEILKLEVPLFHFISEMEKRKIPFAVIGGIAINTWGFSRFTKDVDFTILLTQEQSQEFMDYLKNKSDYKIQTISFVSLETIPDFIRLHFNTIPVDFLVANTDFMKEVIRRAIKITVFGQAVPFATPEDLFIFKLLADRPQDRADIEALLKYHPNMDWAHIKKWCQEWEIEGRLNQLLPK